jgi:peptidoglycan/LPS O-acetylase OafA/YrhL
LGVARKAYWPSLDGVRAVAIAAVILYHLGFFPGGWLGVDIFFVLSGYLITTLLLQERHRSGTVRLRAFWGRRARRLLPAVLLLLVAVALYAALDGAGVVPAQLRAPGLATLFYVANWQQIISGHGYFAQFLAPNPLAHTWSLAVEEQYYVIWPLLFLGLCRLARGSTARLAASVGALVIASAAWMAVVAHIWGVNRAYLGTDTRAWELLLGGLAAIVWPAGTPARHPGVWSKGAVGAAAVAVAGMLLAGGPPRWMFEGGLVLVAAAVAVVIASVVSVPTGGLARLLALAPLRWLGRISYSLYLWHWPVIVVLTASSSGLNGAALLVLRLGAMTALACASYYLVEQPLRTADWHGWAKRALVPASMIGAAAVLLAATITPTEAATAPVLAAPGGVAGHLDLTAARPLRVWILGDSVMYDSSLGIAAALAATGNAQVVANTSYGGWGLSTDHTWPTDLPAIIRQAHPQLVIGTWSWDDPEAVDAPAAYEAVLRRALATILEPGDGVEGVVLLQFPQGGPSPRVTDPSKRHAAWVTQTRGQDAWNRLAEQAASAFPGRAVYLPTSQLFAPHGRYLVWFATPVGTWIRARKLDNTHLCPYGAASLGATVVADLRLGPLADGWQAGAWVHDPRYNDPPGACPADQPPAGYTGLAVP